MYRVLMIVRNKSDEQVTINYGTHEDKFEAAKAILIAMGDNERDWYRVEEFRIEVI